jgi:hypothetical protein
MSGYDQFRDYVYVSTRKISRMAPTLPPARLRRLKDVQVKLGPVGAGVGLEADETRRHAAALIPQIEQALDERSGIRHWTDPDLQVGHWFVVEALPMAYGVVDIALGGRAAMFVGDNIGAEPYRDWPRYLQSYSGEGPPHLLILGGSAEHLLDRFVTGETSVGGSVLIGIGRILQAAAREALDDDQPATADSGWGNLGDTGLAHMYLKRVLGEHGLEPLTAVARAALIRDSTGPRVRTIVGSPLYVALHVPD